MIHRQICTVVVWFFALVVFVDVANAQSKNRDNPTRLTSNEITGLIDSDSKGNIYYYSFTTNPGEVTITLTVEPGKRVNDSGLDNFNLVVFSLFDRNGEKVVNKAVSASNVGEIAQVTDQVEVNRAQTMVLSVSIPKIGSNGLINGKYRLRVSGAVEINQDAPSSKTTGSGITKADMDAFLSFEDFRRHLPKRGTLRVKMKNGSTRIVNLSEVEDIIASP
jgi:hypothetical protein